jgi:hypothetical protein
MPVPRCATRIRGLTRNQWTLLAPTLAFDRQQPTADVRQFLSTFKPRRRRGQMLALTADGVGGLDGDVDLAHLRRRLGTCRGLIALTP